MQRQQWQHPRTGEQAELQLHPDVARLVRAGQVREHRHPADWEAQARQQAAEMQGAMRQHLEAFETASVAGTVQWSGNASPQDNVQWLSDLRRMTEAEVQFSPPSDSQLLYSLTQNLKAEGFIRRTTFDAGRLWLPDELEAYRSALEGSLRPLVRLAADPGRRPAPWDSKVGGVPYRPLGAPWPHATQPDGRPLVFLAQLNLAELNPGGVALPDVPTEGIVQFFILNDEMYGAEAEPYMSLNGAQKHYRVLYWPEVVQDVAALDSFVPAPEAGTADDLVLADMLEEQLPHDPTRETALVGLADREPVSGADDNASRLLGTDIWNTTAGQPDGASDLAHVLYDLAAVGHKLGGYPNFTQSDPRGPEESDLILLFQLDSEDALGLMWGDCGTANFFIRPDDLAARDFSRVAMHWDCG